MVLRDTRTNLFKFGRLFNFQVVNRRKTLYFVYNTVCKKQEGATDCGFCVFLGRHFLETLKLKQAGIFEKKLLYVRLCGVCVV